MFKHQLEEVLDAAAADETELARLALALEQQAAAASASQHQLEWAQLSLDEAHSELVRARQRLAEAARQREMVHHHTTEHLEAAQLLEQQLGQARAESGKQRALAERRRQLLEAAEGQLEQARREAAGAHDAVQAAKEAAIAAAAMAHRCAAALVVDAEEQNLQLQIAFECAQSASSAHQREASRLAAELGQEQQLREQEQQALQQALAWYHRMGALEVAVADQAMRAEEQEARACEAEQQLAAEREMTKDLARQLAALQQQQHAAAEEAAWGENHRLLMAQACADFGARLEAACQEQEAAVAAVGPREEERDSDGEEESALENAAAAPGGQGGQVRAGQETGQQPWADGPASDPASDHSTCRSTSCSESSSSSSGGTSWGTSSTAAEVGATTRQAGLLPTQQRSVGNVAPSLPGAGGSASTGSEPASVDAAGGAAVVTLQARVSELEAKLAAAQEQQAVSLAVAREAAQRLVADASRAAQEGEQARLVLAQRVCELERALLQAQGLASAATREVEQQKAAELEQAHAALSKLDARLATHKQQQMSAQADLQVGACTFSASFCCGWSTVTGIGTVQSWALAVGRSRLRSHGSVCSVPAVEPGDGHQVQPGSAGAVAQRAGAVGHSAAAVCVPPGRLAPAGIPPGAAPALPHSLEVPCAGTQAGSGADQGC